MYLHCPKCLTGRSGDILGAPCKTDGCDGIIAEVPAFSTLVDELPEPMTCGRRDDDEHGADRWKKFKSNGDRVCSFCGSLHPEDFLRFVKAAAEGDETISIDPSDKGYKIYVRRDGVRNAHEGGIKFYMQHFTVPATEEQVEDYKRAVQASRVRFDRVLKSTARQRA